MTKLILALTLTIYSLVVTAQDTANTEKDRQYVTDKLQLSIYQEATSQSKVLALLKSGDAVIVDELRGNYALVTAPDGERGWVKRGYLVIDPPATIQLIEEREKNVGLVGEIDKLANSKVIIETYEKDMDQMRGKFDLLEGEKSTADEAIVALQQELADKQLELDRKMENNEPIAEVLLEILLRYWKIILPGFLALLLLCFLISKVIIESHIKARFHGIKIW